MRNTNTNMNNNNTQTFEKSKIEKYSVSSIIKKIDKQTIRFDHPNQREAEQWDNKTKGNFISDIIQGNPIPAIVLAEQVVNGTYIIWNLDGKQRCTTVYNYVHDAFKVSKKVTRNIISYQTQLKDEDGNYVVDEDRIPVMEWREFDIANKSYSQLPEELQDKIMEYCFDCTLYMNCPSEDIVYHIARYNAGRPMNKTQKGIINLGEDFAKEVKDLANHDFFTDCGEYGKNGRVNGNIDRVICESIMAANFIDDWKTNQEDTCAYIRDNATLEQFDDMNDTLTRLEDLVDGSNESLFTNKESFIWFSVFSRYKKYGKNDDDFAEFMAKFVEELHSVVIGEKSYDDLEGRRSTKDKSLVVAKINHIESLLKDFLGIEKVA